MITSNQLPCEYIYKIGEIAKATGVSVETLRYYEQMALISSDHRDETSNYRLYTNDTIYRVHFIKKAKSLGFTLKEIGELLSLKVENGSSCSSIRELSQFKLTQIENKIADLSRIKGALLSLLKQCDDDVGSVSECSIIRELTHNLLEK